MTRSSTPPPVISVRDLVVRFDMPDGSAQTVLNGVTFDVLPGETVVVMGGSGCGKSTLLNCLIGELRPAAGRIEYALPELGAIDLCSAPPARLNALRKRIGILFQSGALFSSLTVAENVALPLREHSAVDPKVIDIVVTLKLQQVHMLAHRDKYPAQLSGGQRKRVGLARATALDPQVLFYDEPSAGLDPVTSAAIDSLMLDLARKLHVTSVVVTHEMDSAFRIADRMIMLDGGRILRAGTRREFEALRDADPARLGDPTDRLIHQFVTGETAGPLTDDDGLSEFEKILVGTTTTVRHEKM
ncbi:MAG: ATP-binding cassette domain-containing protein [Planctomycetia bacterium]|nr:MAG: ATP-binding cassette domain-containing protein [Planctomycetia bacterium]